MSEKIYFNTSGKFSLRRSLVNWTTRLHHTVAPAHARKTARKLLLTPARMTAKNEVPQGMIKSQVDSAEGKLTTYRLGEGPVWLLTHGWSGASSQFFPLMEHIAAQGYTALAYDHPAHGESEGAFGHVPAFVRGLEAILDSEPAFIGLIGHSMGNVTALECRHAKLADCPMMLIAPVLDYLDNLFGTVARSGYSMRLFEEVVNEVQDEYRYPIHSIQPYQSLTLRRTPTIIVHDEKDRFARYAESHKAAEEIANVTLITTKNQGHGRIMKGNEVKSAFEQIVKFID
ncbi:alpha/beta hydrolase [Vibrio furnissii]|uniref:alpha/beta hydrolase n=1 Tax=Vibrio furnissii TaxID=29494 RepID=UPI0001B92F02|nr:alpha/beta fold hydrolase [Vibrio furnissii]EEX40224.1 predicted hydrolase or acyltransferase [Vibrio furnissii CIP 102972]MCG6266174.1 lysophospholipase [Vibrio furnissii]QDC94925.1 alpha/beta hydrolase [Vibrio furnissii]UHJ62706.1 alpha/beta hydrolase [Vibrio furnissii]UON50364.1 alpha/beta fold hydrolase [Vibrio furnissii]